MALTNFGELSDAITGWMARAPDAEDSVLSRIPDFITLAEKRFYRRLRTKENMFRSQAFINERRESLPERLLEVVSLSFMSQSGDLETEGVRHDLQYVSPTQYNRRFANCTGDPFFYTLIGSEMNFGPFVEFDATVPAEELGIIELVYFGGFQPLAATGDFSTNDILIEYPDLYLYGSLVESNAYIVSDQMELWVGLYERALGDANDALEGAVSDGAIQYRNVAVV